MKEITEIIVIFLLIGSANSCSSTSSQFERKVTERDEELPEDQEALYLKARNDPRSLTDAEWQLILDQATFYVTRQKGTERRWSSSHNKEKRSGTFKCTLCHQPLFSSNTVNYFSLENTLTISRNFPNKLEIQFWYRMAKLLESPRRCSGL